MGMSASQARLLSLQARQSNLEYQGQQINQARSILSQQCTALYNSLLSMKVPTPPSVTDFQTIQYTGTQGASKFTLGTITPDNIGTYNVEMKYSRNGNAIKGGSYLSVTSTYNEPKYISDLSTISYSKPVENQYYGTSKTNTPVTNSDLSSLDQTVMHLVSNADDTNLTYYYLNENGSFVKINSSEDAKSNGAKGNLYVATTIGNLKSEDPSYDGKNDFKYSERNSASYYEGGITEDQFNKYTFYGTSNNLLSLSDLTEKGVDINGNKIYELPLNSKANNPKYDPEQAINGATIEGDVVQDFSKTTLRTAYSSALQAVANTYPEYKNSDGTINEDKITSDFKVIFRANKSGTKVPYFVKTSEFQQKLGLSNVNGQNQVEVFSLEPNGSYTEAVQTEACKLTFDSSGRITKIAIPLKDSNGAYLKDASGNIKYDTVALKAETVADDIAYKDAYAKYEYETYLYDQKNKEINAKTEIIQQEDRNLELKLQRLDNERTQITTEIEAVDKVINDNIEASYKSFSG